MFCGSGGVGKTSVAAAAALGAASRLGGKVLVLTIDPATPARDRARPRRHRQRRAPGAARGAEGGRASSRAASCGPRCSTRSSRGTTSCCATRTDEETAYRILENRLYHNLTARFVQSHDYIAMERLFEIHATGEYDLIVIDTPPTRNAIDFLDAPARMAEFFGGRLLRWLTLPYRVGGKRGSAHDQRREPALLPNGRPHPRQQVPRGHRRVLPELPVDVRRVRRARAGRRAAAARPAHDVRGRDDARGRAAARGRALLRGARRRASFHLGALVLNKTLPDYLLDPAGARGGDRVRRRRRRRSPTRSPRSRDPALADPGAHRARAAHDRRVVPQLLGRRDARGRAARRARARPRRRRARPDLRGRHQRRRRARRDRRATSSASRTIDA